MRFWVEYRQKDCLIAVELWNHLWVHVGCGYSYILSLKKIVCGGSNVRAWISTRDIDSWCHEKGIPAHSTWWVSDHVSESRTWVGIPSPGDVTKESILWLARLREVALRVALCRCNESMWPRRLRHFQDIMTRCVWTLSEPWLTKTKLLVARPHLYQVENPTDEFYHLHRDKGGFLDVYQ